MSEHNHTPGPWTMRSCMAFHRVYAGTEEYVFKDAANARLIASAPEILAALEDAMEIIQIAKTYFPKSIKNRDRFRLLNIEANSIRPAIAKATGKEAQ